MTGQFELGDKHLDCINGAQALIAEVQQQLSEYDRKNPKSLIKEYLQKIDGIYDDNLGLTVVLEEIAKNDSLTAYVLAEQIVFNKLMEAYGSVKADQVLAKGETIGLLCMEPGYSALSDIQTKASKIADGWQIEGIKLISSEQIYSDKYLVFAKDEENKIRLFTVLEENIKINEIEKTISNSSIKLNQAVISTQLKDQSCIGMLNDNYEKIHTLARTLISAIAVGIAHSALINSIQTAKETKNPQGESISSSQSLQFTLADLFSEIEAARMLTYYSADSIDKNCPNIKIASMAKVKSSEIAAKTAIETLHILGNIGFIANSDITLIQRATDSRIKGGTNRAQKAQIYQYMLAKK